MSRISRILILCGIAFSINCSDQPVSQSLAHIHELLQDTQRQLSHGSQQQVGTCEEEVALSLQQRDAQIQTDSAGIQNRDLEMFCLGALTAAIVIGGVTYYFYTKYKNRRNIVQDNEVVQDISVTEESVVSQEIHQDVVQPQDDADENNSEPALLDQNVDQRSRAKTIRTVFLTIAGIILIG